MDDRETQIRAISQQIDALDDRIGRLLARRVALEEQIFDLRREQAEDISSPGKTI